MEANHACAILDPSPPRDCAVPARVELWRAFQRVNQSRRAVRDFDGSPVADEDVEAVLGEALLAPSSGNSQPYVIHWLRDAAVKAAALGACRDQRAARSASTLLVFVAAPRIATETAAMFRAYVESTTELSERSKAYHLGQLKTAGRFLRIAPSVLLSPLHAALTTVFPSLTLAPIGATAVRNWVARSALFAAQTLLLAASARGLDTCPMEGFDPRRLARVLGLKRGDVIALVVAVGRRRVDAQIEPRWRRGFGAAVAVH
jgi:nitroreductase